MRFKLHPGTGWWRGLAMPAFVTIGLAVLPAAAAPVPPPDNPLDLSAYESKVVYENDFSRPQKIVSEESLIERQADGSWRRVAKPAPDAEWIAEGKGGCVVRAGKLWVAPRRLMTTASPRPEPGRTWSFGTSKSSPLISCSNLT